MIVFVLILKHYHQSLRFLCNGSHTYKEHYKVLSYYLDVLNDVFIYIVDDYNWLQIRTATHDSIRDTGCEILYEHEKRTSLNDLYPTDDCMM